MMTRAYHFGYLSGLPPDALADFLERADAVLVDVRYTPLARDPTWRKTALATRLGARYVWLQDLGNINYKNGGPIVLKDVEAGLRALRHRLTTHSVVVMCACASLPTCHRALIAQRLEADGVQVIALTKTALASIRQPTLL